MSCRCDRLRHPKISSRYEVNGSRNTWTRSRSSTALRGHKREHIWTQGQKSSPFLLYKQHKLCDVDFNSPIVDFIKTQQQYTISKTTLSMLSHNPWMNNTRETEIQSECMCVLCMYVSLCAWTFLSCVSRFCRLTSCVHDKSRKLCCATESSDHSDAQSQPPVLLLTKRVRLLPLILAIPQALNKKYIDQRTAILTNQEPLLV